MNQKPHIVINEHSAVTLLAIEKIAGSISPNCQFHTETESMVHAVKKVEDVAASLLITDLSDCADSNDAFINLLFQLCQRQPQLRVIIYSHPLRGTATSMLSRLSQVVFLSRSSSLEEFELAMITLLSGGKYPGNKIKQQADSNVDKTIEKLHLLTHCEKDVIAHLLQGESLSDISNLFHRSIKTVSAHKCNAMRKLDAKNVAELFLIKNEFFSALGRYYSI